MVGRAVLVGLGGVVAGVPLAGSRYRRHLAEAEARLATVDRHVVGTEYGTVEYAAEGTGPPLLVSHGIFHGCDGGLLSVRDLAGDRRVIVPSRFGYLGSSMPDGATAAAQADAFAALLDHLAVPTVDVIAISAGTSAAVQLALRHPTRVDHLVVSSGNFPGSTTAEAPPGWAKVFYSDPAMWLLKVAARPAFARLMGVPPGFPRNDHDRRVMDEMLESIFPVGPRAEGAVFDAFVSNPDIAKYPLENLAVPTLVVHAADDPLATYSAAVDATARIPDATLVSLRSGGHLQLGQTDRVRHAVEEFLSGG